MFEERQRAVRPDEPADERFWRVVPRGRGYTGLASPPPTSSFGKEGTMYASVRRYRGMAPNAVDQIKQRRQEFEPLLRGVPGFQAWYMIRTNEGMITVTLCDEQTGAEESVRVAGDYIRRSIPDLVPNPPEVANGEVAVDISG
jgi:hypothetical protein